MKPTPKPRKLPKDWLRTIARKGGTVRSEAKARASRANGARGGRPSRQRDPLMD